MLTVCVRLRQMACHSMGYLGWYLLGQGKLENYDAYKPRPELTNTPYIE